MVSTPVFFEAWLYAAHRTFEEWIKALEGLSKDGKDCRSSERGVVLACSRYRLRQRVGGATAAEIRRVCNPQIGLFGESGGEVE